MGVVCDTFNRRCWAKDFLRSAIFVAFATRRPKSKKEKTQFSAEDKLQMLRQTGESL
jgi:hypothetical protein